MDVSTARNRKIVLLCMLWSGSCYHLSRKVRDKLNDANHLANRSLYSADVRGTFSSSIVTKFFNASKNVCEMPIVMKYSTTVRCWATRSPRKRNTQI